MKMQESFIRNYQITEFCHSMVRPHIQKGDFCIDATAGNGYDTEFLCRAVSQEGFVLGVDIQEAAIENTRKRLQEKCPDHSYALVRASHEDLAEIVSGLVKEDCLLDCSFMNNGTDKVISPQNTDVSDDSGIFSPSCIMFNLGYLPGGSHLLSTTVNSTLKGLSAAISLLKKGGILSICIYSGGDTGFAEKDAVLSWLSKLDNRQFLVLLTQYYNRPNNPPIPAFVVKL